MSEEKHTNHPDDKNTPPSSAPGSLGHDAHSPPAVSAALDAKVDEYLYWLGIGTKPAPNSAEARDTAAAWSTTRTRERYDFRTVVDRAKTKAQALVASWNEPNLVSELEALKGAQPEPGSVADMSKYAFYTRHTERIEEFVFEGGGVHFRVRTATPVLASWRNLWRGGHTYTTIAVAPFTHKNVKPMMPTSICYVDRARETVHFVAEWLLGPRVELCIDVPRSRADVRVGEHVLRTYDSLKSLRAGIDGAMQHSSPTSLTGAVVTAILMDLGLCSALFKEQARQQGEPMLAAFMFVLLFLGKGYAACAEIGWHLLLGSRGRFLPDRIRTLVLLLLVASYQYDGRAIPPELLKRVVVYWPPNAWKGVLLTIVTGEVRLDHVLAMTDREFQTEVDDYGRARERNKEFDERFKRSPETRKRGAERLDKGLEDARAEYRRRRAQLYYFGGIRERALGQMDDAVRLFGAAVAEVATSPESRLAQTELGIMRGEAVDPLDLAEIFRP